MFGFWYSLIMDNGLVYKIIKDMAPDELIEMGKKVNSLTLKWLEEHPEERAAHARELLNLFKEYRPYGF